MTEDEQTAQDIVDAWVNDDRMDDAQLAENITAALRAQRQAQRALIDEYERKLIAVESVSEQINRALEQAAAVADYRAELNTPSDNNLKSQQGLKRVDLNARVDESQIIAAKIRALKGHQPQ